MGSPQIQADGPLDQGREGLVRSAAPRESKTLCPLATMPRQRPNIGSRMNREVHVRFWERPRVKVPRATRQTRKSGDAITTSALPRWSQPVDATLYLKGEMECAVMGQR